MSPRYIDQPTLRRLSALRPFMGTVLIAREWVMIAAAAASCWIFWHPAVYVLTLMFIGARQHALGILVHESAHYRLARKRSVNDWMSDLLCAWPLLFITTQRYRDNHLRHHLALNTDDDPDWVRKQTDAWRFPQPRARFSSWVASYLFGWGIVQSVRTIRGFADSRRATASGRPPRRVARLVFLAGLAITLTVLGGWTAFLLLWLVPLLTWTQLILHVRSIAEHFGVRRGDTPASQSRTTLAAWWERLLVAPVWVGFHNEHHLYPSVPAYNLSALHAALMRNPDYVREAHITRGYFNVLLECVT